MPNNNQTTLYIGNLDDRVDERLLYEIMVQAGPLVEVHMPRDKDTKRHRGYGFAEYRSEESATYALNLFSGVVALFNRSLRFAMSSGEKTVPSGSGTDRLSTRTADLDKPPYGLEHSCHSPVTSYGRLQGFQRSGHSQYTSLPSFKTPGHGVQEKTKTDSFSFPSTPTYCHSAQIPHLTKWASKENVMGHANLQPTSSAR